MSGDNPHPGVADPIGPKLHYPYNSDTPTRAVAIVPNDATDLPNPAIAIKVGGAGNIAVTTIGGDNAVIAVVAGETLRLGVTRVKATGTTATGLVSIY
jgi:hypothetical protein